jgi:hypothetical protein
MKMIYLCVCVCAQVLWSKLGNYYTSTGNEVLTPLCSHLTTDSDSSGGPLHEEYSQICRGWYG